MTENAQPVFSIEKIYVKDLSLEVPNAPKVFLERENPQINVQLRSDGRGVDDGVFEVVLTVTVSATLPGERALFLVEVAQAGIFQIRNVAQEDMEPILMIGCPNILFPYAREAVSDAVMRAGFQPVILSPVNFESMYHAQREQQGAGAQSGEQAIQ